MTGRRSRDKGARAEREAAALLTDLLGWPVTRRLRTGDHADAGDIDGIPGVCVEVKANDSTTDAIRRGLADLEHERRNASARYGVVLVRQRGGRWVAVLEPEMLARLLLDAGIEP